MKYIGLLISSICVFLVVVANLYYNSITLDIQMIKDYIVETNIILEDVVEKKDYVDEKKDEYISRLMTVKTGIKNSKTTFLVKDYKEYKIKSIDYLIESISERKSETKNEYLQEVIKYNNLCDEELEKLLNKDQLQ
ncbi:MAG: hypothetical protein ACRDA3_01650 [Peptostreptococcaceae bacterium]